MTYIQTIPYEESEGLLRDIYDQLVQSRGKLARVHQIQSLHPEGLLAHMELYKAVMFGRSPLKRYQREMIAVIVSAANKCSYCIAHHQEALMFYWKDRVRCEALGEDWKQVDLSNRNVAICRYAERLTLQPVGGGPGAVEELRKEGFDDRSILDIAQIVAYFNFVNRLVLGLGVTASADEVEGYKY